MCAAENVRAQLAKSVSMSVQSIMVEETRDEGQSVESASATGVKSWVNDAVLKCSVTEEYWYDAERETTGVKGIAYAIACIGNARIVPHRR